MTYPQIIEYQDAVQNPAGAFTDPLLKAGHVAESPLGLPIALSGGFALTYSVTTGARRFAVRCFHKEVPEAQARYAAISSALRRLRNPHFVEFEFEPNGIRIAGQSYPIVRMDWVEGRTLGSELGLRTSQSGSVHGLRQKFVELATFLDSQGIAHGDIQNDNVIVANDSLRLIDYDGMFVPGMREGGGSEVGQKNFQHPEREPRHFGPAMDRFSFIVVDVSLEALAQDPSLYRRFSEGGNAIVFKANDFADPSSSPIFSTLRGMPALRESADKLARICQAPIASVPTLTDFIAGRNIPVPANRAQIGTATRPAPQTGYISAFDVLDGKDYDAVLRRVGDKVELVGQIISVKPGVGRRGKGRGRPYVFINFGVWNQRSVKITIWSEGLDAMTSPPTEAWVGRWISVTGLIEPPYYGKHYGRPYESVGVTVATDNQIVQLEQAQAKFRLSGRNAGPASLPRSNRQILEKLGDKAPTQVPGSVRRRAPVVTPPSPRHIAGTKNQQILADLQRHGPPAGSSTNSAQPASATPTAAAAKNAGIFSKVPGWVWVAGLIIVAVLIFRRR